VTTLVFTFGCRVCAAEVTVVGGRRRRVCDACRARMAVRMRRQRQADRFVRRLDRRREAA
jgi:hypothetical protein